MYSDLIHRRIERLGNAIADVKEAEIQLQNVNDPALIAEYEEELREYIQELEEVGNDMIILLEAYVEDCKEEGLPVYLDYYRVLTELKKAVMNKR